MGCEQDKKKYNRETAKMIPVFQTDLTFETGNCGEACVASILEISLDDIPSLHNPDDSLDGEYYCERLRKFLRKFGMTYIDLELRKEYNPMDFFKDCYVITTGPSPRATEEWHRHAVVWRNGKIIHDPHPSGDGLKTIDMYGVFVLMNPRIGKQQAVSEIQEEKREMKVTIELLNGADPSHSPYISKRDIQKKY